MTSPWGRGDRVIDSRTPSALGSILQKRCPRCREGRVFHAAFRMRETCPCCGLRFDRGEPGYFTGAMYVSYALGIPLIALLTLAEYLILPGRWTLLGLVSLAWLISLPAVPLIWQYSRLIFMNFDQWADPTEPTKLLPGECPTDPGEDAGGVDDR